MTKSDQYIRDILDGSVYHGKLVKAMVERLENDKASSNLWVFNAKIAERYLKFIEKLVFTEGSKQGQNIVLENWQAFYVSQLFGWVSRTDETQRRFVETTLCIPRKNGKSTMIGIIALACGVLDKEERGQIYMAATSQKQARLCFDSAWYSVKKTKGLSDLIHVSAHNLLVKHNNTYIRYISSEASGIEGTNPSVAVLDEEHLMPTNELRDALRLGMGTRKNPLFISISTAGTNKNYPYFTHVQNCKKIINGIIDNDRHFPLIYEPDEGVDVNNPKTWKVANPNYGVSIIPDLFIQDYKEAMNEPSKWPMFVTKRLNIWADVAETWIESKRWNECGQDLKIEDYYGKPAYIGLDLGSSDDFSALSILVDDGDKKVLFTKFYIPEDMSKKRSKKDMINFTHWARMGYITLTDGDATDYNIIKRDIVEIYKNFDAAPLSYDRNMAGMLTIQLFNEELIQVEGFPQTAAYVCSPTKQFYEWVMDKTLIHDKNPVMTWMVSNIAVEVADANGNIRINKKKSANKVDGPASLVNAIGRYLQHIADNKIISKYI